MYKLFSQVVGDVDTTLPDVMKEYGKLAFIYLSMQTIYRTKLLGLIAPHKMVLGGSI